MTAIVAVLLAAVPVGPATEEIELLEFTAPYCGPCKTIQPRIDALVRKGYPITSINISRHPGKSSEYNVDYIPTFVLLIDGKEKHRYQGTQHVGKLKPLMDAAREFVEERRAKQEAAARVEMEAAQPAKVGATIFDKIGLGRRRSEPAEPEVVRPQQPEKAKAPVEKGAMASSVRVRVSYDGKVQYGSGTLVQSRPGRTVVLTCAHIMDQAGENPKIKVDIFQGNESKTYVGKVVGHDIESDVGLIVIPTSSTLPVAKVVRPATVLKKGQRVFSIGCNNGKKPTREDTTLSGIDRYIGPNNLETGRAPEHGRSGGGLFDEQGRVIGVCSAADHKGNHGLYAGTKAIFAFLKKHKLLSVYGGDDVETTDEKPNPQIAENPNRTTLYDSLTAETPFAGEPERKMALADPQPESDRATVAEPPIRMVGASSDVDRALGALGELGGDAEVTVVIRPRDPRKSSRIVVIPHASSNFVSMLQGEVNGQPQHTGFVRPAGHKGAPAAERLQRYGTRPVAVGRSRVSHTIPLFKTGHSTPPRRLSSSVRSFR